MRYVYFKKKVTPIFNMLSEPQLSDQIVEKKIISQKRRWKKKYGPKE